MTMVPRENKSVIQYLNRPRYVIALFVVRLLGQFFCRFYRNDLKLVVAVVVKKAKHKQHDFFPQVRIWN